MKKITLVAIAVMTAATTFAQTSSAKVKSDTKVKSEASANEHGKKVSATATSKTTAESNLHGAAVSETAVQNKTAATAETSAEAASKAKAKKEKTKKKAKDKKAEAEAQTEAATETAVDAGTEVRNNAETHGAAVAELAHTTTLEGKAKGQAIAELASANSDIATETAVEAAAETQTAVAVQEQEGSKKAKKEKAAKESKEKASKEEKHSTAVVETAQSVETTVDAKGKAVKEVATAKRQEKPVKVETNVVSGTAARSAVRVGAGRPSGAGRPVRIIKKGGVVAPVKAGGAVKVKTGIKVGKK